MTTFNHPYGHSPPSPNYAAESAQGTPNTALTAFSPDDAKPAKPTESRPSSAPSSSKNHDPFVTTNSNKTEQKLSATASAFQPFSYKVGPSTAASSTVGPTVAYGSVPTNLVPGTVQYLDSVVAAHQSPARAPADNYGTFSTNTGATRCIKVMSIYEDVDVPTTVAVAFEKLSMSRMGQGVKGTRRLQVSSTNAVYINISDIREAAEFYTMMKLDPKCAVEYITYTAFGEKVSPGSRPVSAHEAQVLITAHYPPATALDRNEFEEALRQLLSAEGELYAWQVNRACEAGTFRMIVEFVDTALAQRAIRRCKNKVVIGTVAIKVEPHEPDLLMKSHSDTHRGHAGPTVTPTRRPAESDISDALGQMSLGQSNVHTPRFPGNTGVFNSGSPNPVGIPYLAANHFALPPTVPYVFNGLYSAPQTVAPFQQGYAANIHRQPQVVDAFDAFGPQAFSPQAYATSPFAQTGVNRFSTNQPYYAQEFGYLPQTPVNSREVTPYNRGSNRRQSAIRSPQGQIGRRQHSNQAAGHHNHVDISRIEEGIDVRTTVMLRNIPNKVDQRLLKEIIDESSHGRYDFMYLRIDFSNDCNVGYAFINFVDPVDIIAFVVARSNQKWHRYKSDKVAEVSYATIQGRDCLVQKFRNSSVMLEPPHYRPKLFFTIHDTYGRAGQEDAFPPSDNASKLKRSCENAEHVGLFAPSAGQHLRDEQRRRRSQYDRGTSLAEREEYGFGDDEEDLLRQSPYQGFSLY